MLFGNSGADDEEDADPDAETEGAMSSNENENGEQETNDEFPKSVIRADSYLKDEWRECPEHGIVLPVALPYVYSEDQEEPEGYRLVCAECRFAFEEFEISNQQWMSR